MTTRLRWCVHVDRRDTGVGWEHAADLKDRLEAHRLAQSLERVLKRRCWMRVTVEDRSPTESGSWP